MSELVSDDRDNTIDDGTTVDGDKDDDNNGEEDIEDGPVKGFIDGHSEGVDDNIDCINRRHEL